MQEKNKVAIIDDDPNIIEIYGTKLKREGFEIISSQDGEAGMELIKRENPDIILLDIMMPKKNGLEVLDELQKNPEINRIPIIILSNVSDQKMIHQVGEFTTRFYVVKSLANPQKITDLVREVLYGEK